MTVADYTQFAQLDIRVGKVTACKVFAKARVPAYQLWLDFGPEIGVKKTSAQLTVQYQPEDLLGKQLIAIVNFPKKQIADFQSECLVLGAVDGQGGVVVLQPERAVPNGQKIA